MTCYLLTSHCRQTKKTAEAEKRSAEIDIILRAAAGDQDPVIVLRKRVVHLEAELWGLQSLNMERPAPLQGVKRVDMACSSLPTQALQNHQHPTPAAPARAWRHHQHEPSTALAVKKIPAGTTCR
ncbi:uncharacterized protein LOC144163306 isoform X1 [Haemaphysalis longicornis]